MDSEWSLGVPEPLSERHAIHWTHQSTVEHLQTTTVNRTSQTHSVQVDKHA